VALLGGAPETPVGRARLDEGKPGSLSGSLYQQIKLARIWFPLAIIGVVLVHQLLIVPLGGAQWQFWAQLLFYSLLGPAATFLTLDWIAAEVRRRERAQAELRALYDELRRSHALLSAIQRVTEQFASATDLDTVLSVAGEGITAATGARGTAILLGRRGFRVTHTHGLGPEEVRDAALRNDLLLRRGNPLGVEEGGSGTVLSAALYWGGKLEGSLHSYFSAPPTPEQRESFRILASEFSAVAEAARSRTRDLLTLFEADRSIRAEGNLERLLETLLTQTMRRADARAGGVYLADEDGFLQLRASYGALVSAPPEALRLGEGFVGRAAAEAEPRVAHRLASEERVGPVLGRAGSALSLPLRTEEELLGCVVLAHPEPEHFREANLPFLNLLAGQVSLAVRNARAYLQSEELAIAEERARIAREIHDGVAQSLAFSALKLDLVSRMLAQPGGAGLEKAALELEATKKTIREAIREVRRSIFALRPIDLERHGFVETIRRYVDDYDQQNDIRVRLTIEGVPKLTAKSEAVLFRIFQEAMNNVAKHARARHVAVRVGKTCDACGFIEVVDDGEGFDPASVSDRVTSAGGLGLKQMRERVQARGGVFEVASHPGQGTRVYASVPE
jgi:signal transduction histidine kinase